MLSGALRRIYFGRHPSTHFPGASMRGRGEGLARGTTGVSTRSVGAARDSTGKGLLETVDCGPELFRASLLLCDHGRRRLGAELWIVELGLDTLQLIQQLGLLACDESFTAPPLAGAPGTVLRYERISLTTSIKPSNSTSAWPSTYRCRSSGHEARMRKPRSPGSRDQSSSVRNGMNGWSRRSRLSRQKRATACAVLSFARRRSLAASSHQSQNSCQAVPYAAAIESWNSKLSMPSVTSRCVEATREAIQRSSKSSSSSGSGIAVTGPSMSRSTSRVAFQSLLQNRR